MGQGISRGLGRVQSKGGRSRVRIDINIRELFMYDSLKYFISVHGCFSSTRENPKFRGSAITKFRAQNRDDNNGAGKERTADRIPSHPDQIQEIIFQNCLCKCTVAKLSLPAILAVIKSKRKR